jgi:putative DNA-binding protein
MHVNLPELQTLLYQLITTSKGAKRTGNVRDLAPGGLEVVARGDERLSAIERVNIYADAYFYRLLDCLYEEFPATFAVVRSDNFAALVRDYLLTYPPTEPSIFHAGRYLPSFLRNHPLAKRWPFISELARLERAILDVFHAADTSTLSDEAMRTLPSQQWPAIKLETHPAVEILRNEWRVTDVLCAVESGREWRQPAHQKTTVLVWRQDVQVNYRDLDDVETGALALLSEGASFAAVCEAVATLAPGPDQVALIGRLLSRWLGDGIIVRADATLTTSPIAFPDLTGW